MATRQRPASSSRPPPPAAPWPPPRLLFVLLAATLGTIVSFVLWNRLQSDFDVTLTLFQRFSSNPHKIRVFGPASAAHGRMYSDDAHKIHQKKVHFQYFSRNEQREFLIDHGRFCQISFDDSDRSTDRNRLLERFDLLPEEWGIEVWKYCYLYTGLGNVYWDLDDLVPLVDGEQLLLRLSQSRNMNLAVNIANVEEAIQLPIAEDAVPRRLSPSFLAIQHPKSRIAVNMMRVLVESPASVLLDAIRLSELLGLYVDNDKHMFHFLDASCQWTGTQTNFHRHDVVSPSLPGLGSGASPTKYFSMSRSLIRRPHHCPFAPGPCCQVRLSDVLESHPSFVLTEPYGLFPRSNTLPQAKPFDDTTEESKLVLPVTDLPYIATIREVLSEEPPTTRSMTPNFFDILADNNCLPEGRDCFKCLKKNGCSSRGGEHDNDGECPESCRCYCRVLCNIRPPPKRISAEWLVRLPRLRHRNRGGSAVNTMMIPRIIHQTWYETITPEKYPNMSRLIESWRQSGWQYQFYNDEQAAQFLSTHFPPAVRQAYDAVIPGAFKADLFRYCVLLIRGGVYADMDVLLESNLDEILSPDVGFVTAQDEPGTEEGHRSCLWNGLLASTPGHPFLMQTIQNVVNGIQNRYTSVDYDDMLCPNPDLKVSHTIDMLFTCGPCILGLSINQILKRHPQTSFDHGEIDLFETERAMSKDDSFQASIQSNDLYDPRWLISGRSILLHQDKQDMGAHRFTWRDTANPNRIPPRVVASTDLPDSDDRPKSLVHYSKTHEKFGIYGLSKLYVNSERTNDEIRIRTDL